LVCHVLDESQKNPFAVGTKGKKIEFINWSKKFVAEYNEVKKKKKKKN
jgi:hypothetical protein